jgi:sugar lactone lactonase YvrE
MYILHADGMISKYQEGTGVPFTQSNLDVPLKNPSSIAVTGFMDEDGYVYVADVGNQRVVQFSKGGEFIRQLRAPDATDMNDLRSIFVDEAAQKLFLLNGNKLYVAQLPQ